MNNEEEEYVESVLAKSYERRMVQQEEQVDVAAENQPMQNEEQIEEEVLPTRVDGLSLENNSS